MCAKRWECLCLGGGKGIRVPGRLAPGKVLCTVTQHLKYRYSQLVGLEVLVVAEVGALHRVDELDGLLLVLLRLGAASEHPLHQSYSRGNW